jgi:predicted short-subunit dehydrogenase-like oxidoreductase (DUF2520 family)
LEKLSLEASIYIVSLTDAALMELLPRIAAGKGDALLVHTAGSVPMDIWKNYATHYGVLYPLQTFSKHRQPDFSKIPFFVEGRDAGDVEQLKALASVLSTKVYEMSSADRQWIHLSAVFACNFVNHAYELAADLLEKHGLSFENLLPLIDETAQKVHEMSPLEAQTGPAVRYDRTIIQKHAKMLEQYGLISQLYNVMSESIHRYATDNTKNHVDNQL